MPEKVPTLTAKAAAALARPGARIYVAGCCGEPTALLDAVAVDPDIWRAVTISGAFIPGVNRRDYSSLGTATTVRTIFAAEGLREGRASGRVEMLPQHYSDYWRTLSSPGSVDIAYFQVPPPRRDGTVGFGIAADFSPATLTAGAMLVGIVNSRMPDVTDGPRLPLTRLAALVDAETPLPAYDAGPSDAETVAIASQIAELVTDGDTIQLGLGRMQGAVLDALDGHRWLALHGGMISPAVLRALGNGSVSRGITTGVALGDEWFLQEAAARGDIAFRPVGVTHAADVLGAVQRLVSINSVLEVDLFGQANAEMLSGRQVSGQGGMVDFVRGARASQGGRSILALPATARNGAVSRIVARFEPGTPVSVARADVDTVVTEFGVAELRLAGLRERAERLIAVAAPQFRSELADSIARPATNSKDRGFR